MVTSTAAALALAFLRSRFLRFSSRGSAFGLGASGGGGSVAARWVVMAAIGLALNWGCFSTCCNRAVSWPLHPCAAEKRAPSGRQVAAAPRASGPRRSPPQ